MVNFTLVRGLDLKQIYHLAWFQGFMYYVNDGVYGSFNCLVFDHATVHPEVLSAKGKDAVKFPSSIWGPSCDSLDCISKSVMLPKVGLSFFLGAYILVSKETGSLSLGLCSGQ